MAQAGDHFGGGELTMYQKINNSMVQVVCLERVRGNSNLVTRSIIPAVPIVSEDKFCCLIALKRGLFDSSTEYEYEVIFPNKKNLRLEKEDIATVDDGQLVLFAFHTTGYYVEAVKFGTEPVKMLQDVLLAGFKQPKTIPCHVSRGPVTFSDNDNFCHSSKRFEYSARGEFVFNTKHEFIGICYMNRGVTRALNMSCITRELAMFLPKSMADEPLSEIIQFIKDSAQVRKQ